ncbi:Hsp20/alpha crystallin family protein [Natrinema pallidum]|uniref:Hsp20/alpha crystallin family protein n=1 Tax=Natrinema pallidum TaxID=69527 RepID=A0A4P9TC49_9EURY|nr:Hsp20/alpha crystallin family protein [Natrinema pallidum]QCW02241.1 Hsp20/alpha crystallin family protein [Natrinema pallidum]
MSETPPHDDRDESPDDYRADDDHWLSSLLSALESLEDGSASTSGRRRSDRTIFDYDISIRSADDFAAESPLDRTGDDARRDRDGGDRRCRSTGPSSDHNVATRTDDDELLVTADVAGADPDDITVGFDETMLVVAVEGIEIDRIEVPWQEPDSSATIKNGVLTVRIRPGAAASEGSTDEEDDE